MLVPQSLSAMPESWDLLLISGRRQSMKNRQTNLMGIHFRAPQATCTVGLTRFLQMPSPLSMHRESPLLQRWPHRQS